MTFARATRLRQPRRLARPLGSKRLYALPLLLVLLIAAGWYLWPTGGSASGPLSGYRASGARDELNCLRLVVGVDVSGSMRDFAAVAKIRMRPTQVAQLGSLPPSAAPRDGYYTYFQPLLTAIDQFPRNSCDTGLVLISDAQLIDLPATANAGRQLLLDHHVGKIRLLVPGAAIQVDPAWAKGFPSAPPCVFDGTNAEATGLALGHTVVGLTGQSLEPIS